MGSHSQMIAEPKGTEPVIDHDTQKQCSKCGKVLPKTAFYKNRRSPGGLGYRNFGGTP